MSPRSFSRYSWFFLGREGKATVISEFCEIFEFVTEKVGVCLGAVFPVLDGNFGPEGPPLHVHRQYDLSCPLLDPLRPWNVEI